MRASVVFGGWPFEIPSLRSLQAKQPSDSQSERGGKVSHGLKLASAALERWRRILLASTIISVTSPPCIATRVRCWRKEGAVFVSSIVIDHHHNPNNFPGATHFSALKLGDQRERKGKGKGKERKGKKRQEQKRADAKRKRKPE